MRLIEQLIQAGFDFSKAPEPLQNSIRVLKNYSGLTNSKVALLDYTLFQKLAQLYSQDVAIIAVGAKLQQEQAVNSNDGFNSITDDTGFFLDTSPLSDRDTATDTGHTHATGHTINSTHDTHSVTHSTSATAMNSQQNQELYLKKIADKAFTFVTAYFINKEIGYDSTIIRALVMEPSEPKAIAIIKDYFNKQLPSMPVFFTEQEEKKAKKDKYVRIHTYPRNYKREAKDMVKEGNTVLPDTPIAVLFAAYFERAAQIEAKPVAKETIEAANIINKALQEVASLQKPAFLEAITPTNKIDNSPVEIVSQVNPKVGSLRPAFLKNVLLGYDEVLTLANGEKHKVHYAIVDLELILASHHDGTFVTTKGYPLNSNGANINDRNYLHDVNAQKQVIDYAQNLDADRIVTTSTNVSGTPIISIDGIVVSGNNRTMSAKLAARQYPQKYEEYKKVLLHKIKRGGFGIDEKTLLALILGERVINPNVENPTGTFYDNQYLKIGKPFLVRVDYDFAAYNTAEMAKYNQDTKKGESPVDRAIKLGAIFAQSPRCQQAMINELSHYDTFSEFYSNHASQNHIKKQLIDCNIITEAQMSSYYEQGFTSAGKDLIESLAAGMVLEREPLIAANQEGVKLFRQIIIGSLTVLLKNRQFEEGFSLIAAINEAVVLQKKMHSSKLTITDYVSQLSVFDQKPTREGLLLHQLLSSGKIIFKKSIEAYNYSVADTQGASLFGDKPDKEQILRTHIISRLNPKIVQFLDRIHAIDGQKEQASDLFATAPDLIATAVDEKPVDELVEMPQPAIAEESPLEPAREYSYIMATRPFDLGTYPKENFLRFEEAKSFEYGYGTVIYSQPLTQKQLNHYSFLAVLEREKYAPGKTFLLKDAGYEWQVTILESTASSVKFRAYMPSADTEETEAYTSNKWMSLIEEGKLVAVDSFSFEPQAQAIAVAEEKNQDPFASLSETKSSWEMSLSEFKNKMPSPAMGRFYARKDGKYEELPEGRKRVDVYSPSFVHYHVLIEALEKGLPVKLSTLLSNTEMVRAQDIDDVFLRLYPSLVKDTESIAKSYEQVTKEHFQQVWDSIKKAGIPLASTPKIYKTKDGYPIQYEVIADAKVSKDETLRMLLRHGENKITLMLPEALAEQGMKHSYKVSELQEAIANMITAYNFIKNPQTESREPVESSQAAELNMTAGAIAALPATKMARERNKVIAAFKDELTSFYYKKAVAEPIEYEIEMFSSRYQIGINGKSWALIDTLSLEEEGIAVGANGNGLLMLFKNWVMDTEADHIWKMSLTSYAQARKIAQTEWLQIKQWLIDQDSSKPKQKVLDIIAEHKQIITEALTLGLPVALADYNYYTDIVARFGKAANPMAANSAPSEPMPANPIRSGLTVWVLNAHGFYNEAVISSSDGNRVVVNIKDVINSGQIVKKIEVDQSKLLFERPQNSPLALDTPQIRSVLINGTIKPAKITHTIGPDMSIFQFVDEHGIAESTPKVIKNSSIVFENEPLAATTSVTEGQNDQMEDMSAYVPGSETLKRLEAAGVHSIVNGEFFIKHPQKVLGKLKAATTRFGKTIEIVTGTLSEALSQIPYNLPTNMKQQVNETVINQELPVENLLAMENIAKAIETTNNSLVKHLVAEKQFKTGRDCGPVYCFEEALQDYNQHLSKEEIECYIWYKWSQGDELGGMWSKMFHYSYDNATFKKWLDMGVCCYDGEAYVYAPIFYSGNLYERVSLLKENASVIIEAVGEDQFNKQLETLESLFPPKLSVSDTNEQTRLRINPISAFAKNFDIASFKDGIPFTRMGYGTVNGKYVKTGVQTYTMSLFDAFKTYLTKLQPNDFKGGATSYEVSNYFLDNANMSNPKKDKAVEADNQRIKQRATKEGLRLFAVFLREELASAVQAKLDYQWNQTYNGFKKINFDKIPVAFEFGKFYNGDVSIRPEKREAVAFILNEGSGVIAYDVGVGKTYSAIFTIGQFMAADYCKRPLIVVPNQVYKQFIAEIKGLLPTVKINEYYNLGTEMTEKMSDDGVARQVDEYSITVCTKEALEMIGFNHATEQKMLDVFFEILNQGKESDKEKAALKEKLQTLMGRGIKGSMYNFEDFGFDFFCCDEAHMLKKVFTSVKGDTVEKVWSGNGTPVHFTGREKSPYKIQSGQPSAIALKGFMVSHYVQAHNKGRNVLLLTATPFTNSPLEIYSMLALVGYNKLEAAGVNNLKAFFDTYVATSNELVISAKMKPERKQVVMGFDNLVAMQQLIRRFINYKTGEDVGVERPNKIVLPLLNKKVEGMIVPLSEEERIETRLPMTSQQKRFMLDVEEYMNGGLDFDDLCTNQASLDFVEEEDAIKSETVEVEESSLSSDEKNGVKVLRGLSLARNIALSPHLYSCSHLGTPTYKQYIEQSPKLQYVIECIRRIKTYCEANQWPVPGVIIYMDRGTDFFQHIKDYLQYEVGFSKDEVGMAFSGIAAARKESIKNKFLGVGYDEKNGKTFDLPDAKRMKVLIGSSTIKEGMNLQKRAAFIFNCFLDWNPTDVKQLEGRIWRFGNIYKYTFIVNPMMENSIDSFIFQKLQEKTSRINEIFAENNRDNALKLEEMNPAELKMALITDPYKIADSEIQVIKERIQDQIDGLNATIAGVEKYKEAHGKLTTLTQNLRDRLRMLLKEASEFARLEKADVKDLIKIMNELLDEGRLDYGYDFISELRVAARIKAKGDESILQANGLTLEGLNDYIKSIEDEIEQIKQGREQATADEARNTIARQIIEQRERENFNSKTVQERVDEFAKVLPLLSERMQYGKAAPVVAQAVIKPKFASVPPVDENGLRLISEEAIAFLEEAIAKESSTKMGYIDQNGVYSLERQMLHKKIVGEFTQNKPCQTKAPVAILTGGLPGSGKSTFLKKSPYKWINDSTKLVHVDADEVRSRLPEYKGWNANSTHDETKDVVNQILDTIGIPCTYDLVYDGTMNKMKNYIPLIEKLRSYGYQIYVLFVRVPFKVSKERVLKRYQNSGRFVPITVIEEAYAAGDSALNQIKTMVDGYIVVDGETYVELEKGGRSIPHSREYINEPEKAPVVADVKRKYPLTWEETARDYIIEQMREYKRLEIPAAKGFDEAKIRAEFDKLTKSHNSTIALMELQGSYAAFAPGGSNRAVFVGMLVKDLAKLKELYDAEKALDSKAKKATSDTDYRDYLLNEIEAVFSKEFPNDIFDRKGLIDSHTASVASHGLNRANSNLEDIYTAYFKDSQKTAALQQLQHNYYNKQAGTKQSEGVTPASSETTIDKARKIKLIKLRAKARERELELLAMELEMSK